MKNNKPQETTGPGAPASGRRAFLARGAAVSAAAVASAKLIPAAQASEANLPPNVPAWMKTQGGGFLNPPYGLPSPFEKNVVRKLPATVAAFPTATRTPLQNLFGTITPNGLFFERHHAGVPVINPDEHRLMVHGLVERPLLLTMNDLMRYPSFTRIYFLECSGNSAAEWNKPTGKTAQDVHGLLSCSEWTGVPLSTILDEVGVKPEGKWLLAEGADAAAMTRSIPLEIAMKDALLVYAQNGERLRPEQGYPLRLLLPGIEGNMSIKWLRRLKIGNQPFYTREETSKYTDLMPDGKAREFTFEMDVKSVITTPSGGQTLREKGLYEISGIAWSGRGKIRSVDVSVDGGRNWREAVLQGAIQSKAVTRFCLPWRWNGEPAILQSRAIDETGAVQPTRQQLIAARGTKSFYHYNGIQSWKVATSGEITNVHA
ncbi:sulfite dehydrogenase [Imbroritus primus]|uniref:Sulfite dehydrogenase n=1 Tax=Imbroritus primus TaxID=3058603 RepID=A0ACD3SQF9_9BURK|nr:sulfite dehydrogenase [Burkholderiaceae bacterium PBA]